MNLTEEETAALLRELDDSIDGDRYFMSQHIRRYPPGGTSDASREAVDQMVVPKAA